MNTVAFKEIIVAVLAVAMVLGGFMSAGEHAATEVVEIVEEVGRLDGLIIGIDPGHQAKGNISFTRIHEKTE